MRDPEGVGFGRGEMAAVVYASWDLAEPVLVVCAQAYLAAWIAFVGLEDKGAAFVTAEEDERNDDVAWVEYL